MTHQPSLSEAEVADQKNITPREKFLARMEEIIPWPSLTAVLEPFYPKGERGRPPVGLERMLRMYFLQQWYGLADEALEDAIYDSQAMRKFAGIDLGAEGVPDATKLLKFRRLLETNDLCQGLFTAIHADAGYAGVEKPEENAALDRSIDWQIARKRGQIKTMAEGAAKETLKETLNKASFSNFSFLLADLAGGSVKSFRSLPGQMTEMSCHHHLSSGPSH